MWRILQFFGQVLTSPVFIMFAIKPQAAFGDIVNNALIGYPDFFSVLPVSKCQLKGGIGW